MQMNGPKKMISSIRQPIATWKDLMSFSHDKKIASIALHAIKSLRVSTITLRFL
jgi:hypothetical protein